MRKAIMFSVAFGVSLQLSAREYSPDMWKTNLWGPEFSSNLELQASIKGIVRDTNGPLAGVTVSVVGKSKSVQTGSDGSYTIQAVNGDKLRFSAVGYTQREILVSSTQLNVTLQFDDKAIDEVVVTAFGIDRDRKSLGYSTPKVAGDDVSETQREAFFQGLQGRVPGLSINTTSGLPGASAQIVLRGFNSISGDNNALIVVDGVPIDNSTLNENDLVSNGSNANNDYSNRGLDINPQDIETYVVMKGPEATAMFGSQGSGGAILITTKRAKSGAFNVVYNYSGRIETPGRMPERQFVYGQGTNGNYLGNSVYSMGPKFSADDKIYTNNINDFFRTGLSHKHNVSMAGGYEKISYRWSNEFSDNTGIVPNTRYTRYSTRLAGTAKFGDKIDVNTSLNYVYSDNDKARKGLNGYLTTLLRFNPLWDINDWIDEKKNRVLHNSTIFGEYDNPFWDAYRNTASDQVNRVLASSTITYKPTKWLNINGTGGVDYSLTHGESVYHGQSFAGSGSAGEPRGGSINSYDRTSRILAGSLMATARGKFGDFSIRGTLGGEFKDYNYVTNSQYGEDFYDPDFYSVNNTYLPTRKFQSVINNYRTVGALAQSTIGYKELLYLTLTGRLDGASRLMPNNPWFAYPSASLAFNFTDLDYFKNNLSWLNEGRLRASVGTTGKAPFRTYFTRSNLEPAKSTGGGFAYGVNGGNPNLRAEKSADKEIGFELAFLQNRVRFDYTYFKRNVTKQIIMPRLSYGSGFVLRMMNGGELESWGSEMQLTVNPIKKKDFNWDLVFNYTMYRAVVKSLAEELPELYESDSGILSGVRSAVHPGHSIGALSGTSFKRNNNGDVLINSSTGLPIIGTDRYSVIGDRIPKFSLGTVNKLNYKDFYLTFLWDLRVGGDVLNGLDYRMYTYGTSVKTLNREVPRVINGVFEDGLENSENPTKNNIAVTPYYSSSYYFTNIEPKQFIEKDIWTMRLRDITFRYKLPKHVTQFMGSKSGLEVFFTATDLVMFTNYTGLDPESNSNTPSLGGIGGYGIDYGNMGKPKGYNFGLTLKL